ncbi:MAG: ligase-associated DNA damage response DEXH box helicase [Phycisphaerales bacterium]
MIARPPEPALDGTNAASGADPLWAARQWFSSRGWTAFDFQVAAWRAYLEGRDGLIHAPTGTGKTLAAWLGPLLEDLSLRRRGEPGRPARARAPMRGVAPPLRVVWITPLRALAGDTLQALEAAARGLETGWLIEGRTGDTRASLKARQRQRLPTALITTPESLSLLLSYPGSHEQFASLRCVIADEWHELLGTKRGVQTELCLARLRRLAPGLRTWGLSATLGNLDEAMRVLVGTRGTRPGMDDGTAPPLPVPHPPALISADERKAVEVMTLIPPDIERFPWAGHLGIRLLPRVVERVRDPGVSATLAFTNTRSQTEIWFQQLQRHEPSLIGHVGLHHGSIGADVRRRVEDHLRAGTLRCVVCTSSLDLGVDFQPVDQVIQIGSPKGVARLLQRAGRSGHQPGRTSRIVCVPTNALELVEFAAAEQAIRARDLESRTPIRLALDVLVQHVVTLAAGLGERGIDPGEVLDEVRTTHSFAGLSEEQWQWCLDFLTGGGPALRAYPQYARLAPAPSAAASEGAPESLRLRVATPAILRLHRLNIGTITSDPAMLVRVSKSGRGEGTALGTVEEGFIARLKAGDVFAFAGRLLRLVRIRGMTAYTMPAQRTSGSVPSWAGARMPMSTQLATAVREQLARAARGVFEGPVMQAAEPLLRLQGEWSSIPRPGELLIEHTLTRHPSGRVAAHHVFVYPLEGRLVHEGLAALVASRLARESPRSFSFSCNDFGFELASADALAPTSQQWRRALSTEALADDLLGCLNAAELSRRQFRDVARIAGLILPTYPGEQRRMRHVQASSDMFYDVLAQFDPGSLLLDQARREVLDRQLEVERLRGALERLAGQEIVIRTTERLTPFAFPLWADGLREQLSTEKWADRIRRMAAELEEEADQPRRGRPTWTGRGQRLVRGRAAAPPVTSVDLSSRVAR